jgi:hypothetical protein
MNQTKTVESRVLAILRDCPCARYDDMVLILQYYNRYSFMRVGELPFEDIVFRYKLYGLPCFETIRRARQRVQALIPELSRTPPEPESDGLHITVSIGGEKPCQEEQVRFKQRFSRR